MKFALIHFCIVGLKKMAFSSPRRVAPGLLSPFPRVYADGRTPTSEAKFLASIGSHIFLPMVLRWRTLRLSSAIIKLFATRTLQYRNQI